MADLNSDKIITARFLGDIPEVKPGQILVAPSSNRMYDERIHPVDNFLNFPQWFKDLDSEQQTLKRCQGTQDYLTTGMTLRLPSDVKIRLDAVGQGWESRYEVAENIPHLGVESFSYDQTGPIPATEGRKIKRANWIKLLNPWEVKTAPGWSSMILPVLWEQSRDWSLVPGVVHTDFYHHMNWVLNIYTDAEELVIPMGTPVAHVITFPRTVKSEVVYGDEGVHNLIYSRGMGSVFGGHVDSRDRKYRIHQRKVDSGCPIFHGTPEKKRGRWSRIFRSIWRH